jgi:hypothetical protein
VRPEPFLFQRVTLAIQAPRISSVKLTASRPPHVSNRNNLLNGD